MFEHLAKYDVVYVTGPQRSGTRIGAKAIAYDTGHFYVDETGIGTDSVYDAVFLSMSTESKIVIQCPALMHCIDGISNLVQRKNAVVVMKRDEEDILASQERIGWEWEWLERIHYPYYPEHWPICRIKYANFNAIQFYNIKSPFLVNYDSLAKHRLWVPPEDRRDFHFMQTEVERGC